MFSDSVLLSSEGPIREAFDSAATAAMVLQGWMGERGVLYRGGITYGAFHHEEKAMFGPALIEAHDVENNIADWPRVVLHPQLVQRVLEAPQPMDDFVHNLWHPVNYIICDESGLHYLDYLGYWYNMLSFEGLRTEGHYNNTERAAQRSFLVARETVEHEVDELAHKVGTGIADRHRLLRRWGNFARYLNRAVDSVLSFMPAPNSKVPSWDDSPTKHEPLYTQWARYIQAMWQQSGTGAADARQAIEAWWIDLQKDRTQIQACRIDLEVLSQFWRVEPRFKYPE